MILKNKNAFTLIELLVVISIIGILVAVSIFGLSGARESSRDARRKSDLETIRSGLEMYKADCGSYPVSLTFGSQLTGTEDEEDNVCSSSNIYISEIPADPLAVARVYRYSSDGDVYSICASLERGEGSVSCGGSSNCGTGATCNYQVTNP